MANVRYSSTSAFDAGTVGVDQLDQARGGPGDRLAVALLDVAAQAEVAVVDVGVVARAELRVDDLGEVVRDEAEVPGEVIGLHLRHFPAGQVGVPAVVKGHVVPDRFRQCVEQVEIRAVVSTSPSRLPLKTIPASADSVPLSSPRENEPCSM